MSDRNVILDEYYKEKIKLVQKQTAQIDEDYKLWTNQVNTLVDIKNMLKKHLQNDSDSN